MKVTSYSIFLINKESYIGPMGDRTYHSSSDDQEQSNQVFPHLSTY